MRGSDLPASQARSASAPASARGTVLIVYPDASERDRLRRILQVEGFRVILAAGGEAALQLFEREWPDLVLVNVDPASPVDFETVRRIKQFAGRGFTPLIVLSNSDEGSVILRAAESGGDDFISTPVSARRLKARILVSERVRDLHRANADRQAVLAAHLERDREEQALAEHLLSHAVRSRNVAMDRLGLVQRPAAIFNGDLMLSQFLPDGGLRVLLGDFTGHGLAAAVGVLPVADAFHTMTRKGVSDSLLLAEINRKLYQLLPADRFMAACLVSLPGKGEAVRWWNGGMPSAWLRTRSGLTELTSHALPLGILPELPAQEIPRRVHLCGEDRILMMSDGLLEASDRDGVMFVNAAFDSVLHSWQDNAPILPRLIDALDQHCQGAEQLDDIAALEIPLDPSLLMPDLGRETACPNTGWCWSLDLEGARLCNQPTLESALRPLGFLEGLEMQQGVLETILAELFTNALDHGVLKLDSLMKVTPEGFDAYYRERSSRLASEVSGMVSIRIGYEPGPNGGGSVRMCVRDSGGGFDEAEIQNLCQAPLYSWGRGIMLLRQLCESLVFRCNGSEAEVLYRW
ncbi:ATP-binding SpoIIE family protein phosphatase [Thiorhodococcus fuscus]|uniref:SpoIIE family protein phosphatase n=1 Tax=Thiorhodococcus fuscus TaxID=527200 RepID=A0ABW4Y7K7_9GAMM